jgi:hypothetical protein
MTWSKRTGPFVSSRTSTQYRFILRHLFIDSIHSVLGPTFDHLARAPGPESDGVNSMMADAAKHDLQNRL